MRCHSNAPDLAWPRRAMLAVTVLVLSLPLSIGGRAAEPPSGETAPAAQASAAADTDPATPVILLTGFEPFGPSRPPNPSWEGIKQLDGQKWRDYRLVCRQLPVVWGQPLEQIGQLLDELRPVAVFSFGQGAPGAFALESRAGNRRGNFPDNNQQAPPKPVIVEQGPAELKASGACQRLRDRLADQGHSVRVSQNAGAYLCEETLYSLEYLKSRQTRNVDVLFCHVPPLDGKQVTPAFVQAFVLDLLAAWQTPDDEPPAAPGTNSASSKPVKEDARTAEVRKFIDRYFRTWSNREMDAYGDGFFREAVIQHVDERGQITTQATPEFLADQRRYQSIRPAREVPLAADIRFEGPLARAVVHWKLEDGMNAPKYGYDHFTLARREGKWRILNLVFYGTDPPKNSK